MIKLFRKTRLRLLAENRLSRYLIYALGEIVLVVIGILLALALNRQNDYRKDRLTERDLLENILGDLRRDSLLLELNISNNINYMAVFDTVIRETSFNPNYGVWDFIRHNRTIPLTAFFECSKGTYVQSLSSGTISQILNDSIRERILTYYELDYHTLPEEFMQEQYSEIYKKWSSLVSHSKEFGLLLGHQTNLPPLNVNEISQNPDYGRLLLQKYSLLGLQIQEWKRFMGYNEQLRTMIEQELK